MELEYRGTRKFDQGQTCVDKKCLAFILTRYRAGDLYFQLMKKKHLPLVREEKFYTFIWKKYRCFYLYTIVSLKLHTFVNILNRGNKSITVEVGKYIPLPTENNNFFPCFIYQNNILFIIFDLVQKNIPRFSMLSCRPGTKYLRCYQTSTKIWYFFWHDILYSANNHQFWRIW